MKVAVAGLFRAIGQEKVWDVLTLPVVAWIREQVKKLKGEPSDIVPWEDLPEWFKELPDSKLRGPEGLK